MTISVFYLDDEEALCEIFSEYFSSEEVRVTTFVAADQAIELCKKDPPDVFFIDYRLLGTTGVDVAFAVADNIPKILVTGDLHFSSEYEFREIISKPYEFGVIQSLIDDYIK
jgi:DNA-binding NtrC family response regulator